MPQSMREEIQNYKILNQLCGTNINLWGYFLALADLLIKNNGMLGVVIPINIARGRASEKVRELLMKNFTCKFILKPLEDDAFSEGSYFKDIL